MTPRVTVVTPIFEQEEFLARAMDSLLRQRLRDWECVVVDDGSERPVELPVEDGRVRLERWTVNQGLGAALNHGLRLGAGSLMAYLPADDVWYEDHLERLVQTLEANPAAVAAYSGVRHHYNRTAEGPVDGEALQLVQVMHRRTSLLWMERRELVTDDLERMFWARLRAEGAFVGTGQVTCEWVDHPGQRHKAIREPIGGLNRYRSRYRVQQPLRFHSSAGHCTDEAELYARFRGRTAAPAADGLKIALVGELAYNPDRVLALEELGHRLYGLWMPEPYGYNTVGPLPFGNVADLSLEDVPGVKPDVFYGLLNWQAVPWAHAVMTRFPEIPFVWHFKEGPFICINRGTFPQLLELYARSAGQVYVSEEMREWFADFLPEPPQRTLVLDGDLPKQEWFEGTFSPKLSEQDGEWHTVVAGRPIGLHAHVVAELAAQGIHVHFYGEATHALWKEWIERTGRLARGYLHLHPNVDCRGWVQEFSRYDAGWLHFFESRNEGEMARADWDDLNVPARIGPMMAAGLPLLQRENAGARVATERLAKGLGIGLSFRDAEELAEQLQDRVRLAEIAANVRRARQQFTFDHHAPRLVAFFRSCLQGRPATRP
ncbi:MAG: glycosyltransferase [Bryobacteraceae bacterium]|nr:glycosyltransferase [Bryobacteraceae bacterium]